LPRCNALVRRCCGREGGSCRHTSLKQPPCHLRGRRFETDTHYLGYSEPTADTTTDSSSGTSRCYAAVTSQFQTVPATRRSARRGVAALRQRGADRSRAYATTTLRTAIYAGPIRADMRCSQLRPTRLRSQSAEPSRGTSRRTSPTNRATNNRPQAPAGAARDVGVRLTGQRDCLASRQPSRSVWLNVAGRPSTSPSSSQLP
jgi:hypothetical protein